MIFSTKQPLLILAALISSCLGALAQSNEFFLFGNSVFGAISLVPLFWAMRRSPGIKWSQFLLAIHLGLASPLQYFWLASFQSYAIWTITSVTIGFMIYGILFGPLLTKALQQPSPFSIFAGAMVWALYEFLRSNGFFAFPWGNLPYPFLSWDLFIQGADWGGIIWLTFLIAGFMILVEHWMTEGKKITDGLVRGTLVWGLIFLVHLGYSAWTTEQVMVSKGTLNAVMIQQNADPWIRNQELPGMETSIRLSQEGLAEMPDTDLVIWSENSLRRPLQLRRFYEETPQPTPLFEVVRNSGTHWLFGNPYIADSEDSEDRRIMNSAVLMGSDSEIKDVYGKSHLVPIAEVIPFFDLPPVKEFFQRTLGLQATWVPNPSIRPMSFRTNAGLEVTIGTPICFEDAFPYVTRTMAIKGADVLIVLSNDSWSKTNSSQIQHQIVAMFRSIETRIPMIRSTNSGYTAVNDPRGKIIAGPLPFYEAGYLKVRLPLERFPYIPLTILLGDWTGWLFFYLTLIFLVLRGGILKQTKYSYFSERLRLFSSSAYGRLKAR